MRKLFTFNNGAGKRYFPFSVWVHAYMHAHVFHDHMYTTLCTCIQKTEEAVRCLLLLLWTSFIKTGSLTQLEINVSTRMADQGGPRVCLLVSFNTGLANFLCGCWVFKLSSSHLQTKVFCPLNNLPTTWSIWGSRTSWLHRQNQRVSQANPI